MKRQETPLEWNKCQGPFLGVQVGMGASIYQGLQEVPAFLKEVLRACAISEPISPYNFLILTSQGKSKNRKKKKHTYSTTIATHT